MCTIGKEKKDSQPPRSRAGVATMTSGVEAPRREKAGPGTARAGSPTAPSNEAQSQLQACNCHVCPFSPFQMDFSTLVIVNEPHS